MLFIFRCIRLLCKIALFHFIIFQALYYRHFRYSLFSFRKENRRSEMKRSIVALQSGAYFLKMKSRVVRIKHNLYILTGNHWKIPSNIQKQADQLYVPLAWKAAL